MFVVVVLFGVIVLMDKFFFCIADSMVYQVLIVDGEWEVSYRGSKPLIAVIELTTRCNLSCIHCFRNTMRDSLGDMPKTLVDKILSDLAQSGVKRIVFTGFGEPLVYPHIDYVLEKAKSLGFEVVLNTNGILIDKHIDSVMEYVDYLIVSIEASEESLYREIRIGSTLSKVMENIELLTKLKESRMSWRPVIEFWYTVNRYNIDNLFKTVELAQKLGVYRLNISNYIPIRLDDDSCCLCDTRCIERLDNVVTEISKLVMESIPTIYTVSFLSLIHI